MFWLCAVAVALIAALLESPVARGAEVTCKLRIAWGGGVERSWRGTVNLSAGSFEQIEPLGIEADEPGSIWLDGSQIRIRQPSPRAYDGIDVVVTADLDARLTVWLSNDQAETAKTSQIALRDLMGPQPYNTTLDDEQNRLFVSRAPGDRLRVDFDRDHLVFAPGETCTFTVLPYEIGTSTAGLELQAKIVTNPGGERVWAEQYTTGDDGTETSVTLRVPQQEGVYDLMITAWRPAKLTSRFGLRKPLVARKIQFVVLAGQPPHETGEAPNDRVVEIDPANPRWWELVAKVPLLGGFSKGPLGSGDAETWKHPTLGSLIRLGPGGAAPDISWQAYPLPIDEPGQVHVLEIEYPSDVPQTMGISLLEPNAAGAVAPIGLDSGVYVSAENAQSEPKLAKHRVVFWPRTKTPVLLVTNRRAGARAVYGTIRVTTAARNQFNVLPLSRSERPGRLPPAFEDTPRQGRLWAGYMDRPLVPENFGAPESLDGKSYSLDDWNTFYQGGSRLVDYLRHVGYGGLMLSVYADGSTIYPSRHVQPTPRYDTGVFFVTGQDPQRKDALELLFRLFDRQSLVLIPALQFAAPLAELEAAKRAGGPEAAGIEWIGADGQPWTAANRPRQGLAPYYNLLDPRVQQAMLTVIREVLTRYGAHESFGGLALQLSPDGYAQLPGADWGFDDATIARFEGATRVRVPGSGPGRFAERARFLRGPANEAWLDWRAKVVADFHHLLKSEIAARHPGAKLYLAAGTMLEDGQTRRRLRPTLPRQAQLADTMRELGIDTERYRGAQDIVVLRPQLLRPEGAAAATRWLESETYLSSEMDLLFAGRAQRGSLFYHEPQKARLASFDAASPFGADNTYTWLVSQMSPAGPQNRRRFVHSLAAADSAEMFDGGWLLPMGQEAALGDLLSVYRQLPSEAFATVPAQSQPVTIRTLSQDGATYVYLVNDSPWEVSVSMQLDAPAQMRLEQLGRGPGVGPLERAGAVTNWTVALRPYDLAAARLSAADVGVRNPIVTVPADVRASLQQQIDEVVARVAALGNPQPLDVIENAGFETPLNDKRVVGWSAMAANGGRVALDPRFNHSGQHALLLSSTGGRVSIASTAFDPPRTGRMSVEVRLRAIDAQRPPSVQIAVEGELPSGVFNQHGVIERIDTSRAPRGWERYSFRVDALPSEGLSKLRVRLELLGPGEVWIDDVQVYDLSFKPAELIELSKIVSLASVKLDQGQYADCARLLEGYWPRLLIANVAPPRGNTPLARRPKPEPPPAEPPPKPSMFETIRNYFR